MDSFDLGGHAYRSRRATSEELGVHPTTLSNWRCSGREPLRSYKFGHGIYYRQDDIDAYLARHRVAG
ncbi:hypothetical protein GCM10023350_06430 [Nocardioides endophyticus]|uniref:Helix-turn-helix domain-containing protein n=1 Tax=Nocardioides endophyticus TaxID=1353775 RepID=A0ABP8YDR9_9ACTN